MSRNQNIDKIRSDVEKVLSDIVLCCAINSWSPSTFGREFNGDPNFVRELRQSRTAERPRRLQGKTKMKLRAFLVQWGVQEPKGV